MHEVLICLLIVNENVTKYVSQKCQNVIINVSQSDVFLQALNASKLVFVRALTRTPLGSSRRSLRSPSRLGRETVLPHTLPPRRFRRLHIRRLDLGAYGASVVRPQTQIPGYAYG